MSRCTECGRKADPPISAQRYGGGNWRRPGRWYRTTICVSCAHEALAYRVEATARNQAPGDRWRGISFRSIEFGLGPWVRAGVIEEFDPSARHP